MDNNRSKYEKLRVEIVSVLIEDIITTSSGDPIELPPLADSWNMLTTKQDI